MLTPSHMEISHSHLTEEGFGNNNLSNAVYPNEYMKNIDDVTHNVEDKLIQNFDINTFTAGMANVASSSGTQPDLPPPPKRPLTPYMRFSKYMWQQVKSDNPGLSVCEIGSTIGRMWRELSIEEKQKHNDDFTLDKVRYDGELKQYLKSTGLKSRDLVKLRGKNKSSAKGSRKLVQSPPNFLKMRNNHLDSNHEPHNMTNPHFGQSFFTLGPSLNMPMGMLSGFSQMWIRQQYPSQQLLASMHLAQPQDVHGADAFHSSLLMPGINLPSTDYY